MRVDRAFSAPVLLLSLLAFTAACDGIRAPAPDPLPASVHTRGEIRDFALAARGPWWAGADDAAVLTSNLGGPCWEVLWVWPVFDERYAVYIDEAGERGPYVVAVLEGENIPLILAAFNHRMVEWLAPTPTPTPTPTPIPTTTPLPPTPTPAVKMAGDRFVNSAYGYTIETLGWIAEYDRTDPSTVSFSRRTPPTGREFVTVRVFQTSEDLDSIVELIVDTAARTRAAVEDSGSLLRKQNYGFGNGTPGKELVFDRVRMLLAAQAGMIYVVSHKFPNESPAQRDLAHSLAFIPMWTPLPTPTTTPTPTPTPRPTPTPPTLPTPTPRPESLRCLEIAASPDPQ